MLWVDKRPKASTKDSRLSFLFTLDAEEGLGQPETVPNDSSLDAAPFKEENLVTFEYLT